MNAATRSSITPGTGRGNQRRLLLPGLQTLWYPRAALTAAILAALCLLLAVHLTTTGTYPLGAVQAMEALVHPGDDPASTIVWTLRLPGIVTALATGAALGTSGLLFQSVSRNELGSPEILGLVSGAALGAVIGVTLLGTTGWSTALASVAGCAVAVVVNRMVLLGTDATASRLLLVGIGLSALWSSLSSLLLTRTNPDVAIGAQTWLTGSLNARTWQHALVPGAALAVAVPLAVVLSRHLSALDAGTDMARQLGVHLPRLTHQIALVGIILTGAAIASTGPISFVALAAPHAVRRLVTSPSAPVLTCALMGSFLLLGADSLVHLLPEQQQVPVGIATSVLGGLYLLFIVTRRPA